MFAIEDHVPIPGGKAPKIPDAQFEAMQVGQSFFAPWDAAEYPDRAKHDGSTESGLRVLQVKISSAASAYAKKHPPFKFKTQTSDADPKGVRVWRTE
jgi:hypothetical protein